MKLTAAAPVFPVADLDASVRFFVDKLGFHEEFRYEGIYAGIERDHCLIHLSKQSNPNTSAPGTATLYVFCDDARAIYDDVIARGARPDGPPKDYPYGMRDFMVRDLDGNRLSFGSPIGE